MYSPHYVPKNFKPKFSGDSRAFVKKLLSKSNGFQKKSHIIDVPTIENAASDDKILMIFNY